MLSTVTVPFHKEASDNNTLLRRSQSSLRTSTELQRILRRPSVKESKMNKEGKFLTKLWCCVGGRV